MAVEVRRQVEVEGLGPIPSGPPPSHRDQALSALAGRWLGLLDPAVGGTGPRVG